MFVSFIIKTIIITFLIITQRLFGVSHIKCQSILLVVKLFTFIHNFLCIHNLLLLALELPPPREKQEQPSLDKVYFQRLDYVTWMLFGSATGNESGSIINSKVLISIGGIISFLFNVYLISKIMIIVGNVSESKVKYYQMMDQMDAYAQKKQLPMHIQERLR